VNNFTITKTNTIIDAVVLVIFDLVEYISPPGF